MLVGGPGEDDIGVGRQGHRDAGDGNDTVLARDGEEDTINCGAGEDYAVVDAVENGVFDCETIEEPPGTNPEEGR